MIDIAVLEQSKWQARQEELVRILELPLVRSSADAEFILQFDAANRLTISSLTLGGKAIYVELQPLRNARGKDPLMKAIGYQTRTVFDATTGWATDAMHIASHQIQTTTCERNPVVYALVADGLHRCTHARISCNLSIQYADSIGALNEMQSQPEVIYLDPMYPAKSSSAAPKKALQLLQGLYQLRRYCEQNTTANETQLLETARRIAERRVVVKRPHHAPPIAPNPSGAVAGKLVRFDIYSPL